MSYDNTNKGAIWKNDNRERDTQPHFKGNLNVDGVEYYVSAWKREEGAHLTLAGIKVQTARGGVIGPEHARRNLREVMPKDP